MSINNKTTASTPYNGNIDKHERFYDMNSKWIKKLTSCVNFLSCTRKLFFLIPFSIFNILAGIAITTAICHIVFLGTHWKDHRPIRKAMRVCVISVHYIILPIVSVVLMWIIYYKKQQTTNTSKCLFDCSVFRSSHGSEQGEIPKINFDFEEHVEEFNQRETSGGSEKKYYNIGRWGLILLHFLTPILYLGHGGCQIGGAIYELINDTGRQPTENFTSDDIEYAIAYSGCTLGYFFLNFFLVIPVVVYVIKVYFNIMYKSAWLKQILLKNCNPNQSKQVISRIFKFYQSPDSEFAQNLCLANIFSSVYILAIVLFDVGYILYLFTENLTDDYLRWASIPTLSISGFFLLLIMVLTNQHVQELKKSILFMSSIIQVSKTTPNAHTLTRQNHLTTEAIPMTAMGDKSIAIYDISYLDTIMNYFDTYATIFGFAPYLSTLAAVIVTQAITIIVPFALKAHGVIKTNESVQTYLDTH